MSSCHEQQPRRQSRKVLRTGRSICRITAIPFATAIFGCGRETSTPRPGDRSCRDLSVFTPPPAISVDGGRLLIGELNCVACHAANRQLVNLIRPKQAPILDQVGERLKPEWMIKFIASPHEVKPGTTMPDLMVGMNAPARQAAAVALTNFLVGTDAIKSGGQGGDSASGEQLFHETGCVACHQPRNDKKASTDTSVPLVALDEKYTRASLEQFLKNPHAVRPSGRMPQLDLGGDNWRHVAQYLTGDLGVTFGNQKDLPAEPNMKFAAYYVGVDRLPDLSNLSRT